MIDTLHIYQDLAESLGDTAARKLAATLGSIYSGLQQTVTKDDFRDLKQVGADLAEAQKRTEERVEQLAHTQEQGFRLFGCDLGALAVMNEISQSSQFAFAVLLAIHSQSTLKSLW